MIAIESCDLSYDTDRRTYVLSAKQPTLNPILTMKQDISTLNYFLSVGYTAPQAMGVLIGVALKTVSNYLVHTSPAPIDDAFKAEANS
jgi:hypothetical protein